MNSRFDAIFEKVAQGVLLVDVRTSRIVRANHHFAKLVDWNRHDFATLTLDDLVDPVDLLKSRVDLDRLHAGSIASIEAEWHYVRCDGSRTSSRTIVILVRDQLESAPLYVLLIEDLTLQHALEDRLRLSSLVNGAVVEGTTQYREKMEELVRERTIDLERARDDAESANRAKSAFLATVSHELRTPLNAIIGFSSLLLEHEAKFDPDEQRKQLSIIRESSQQLLELIREILDVASIEAGRLALQIDRVRLCSVIDEQVQFAQAQAGARHLDLSPAVCDPSITVQADARRLGQVLRNLLSNALKFTDRGHIAVRASVAGHVARIEVEDTGIGISADVQDELFVPFHRIHEDGGALRPGTGLGLSISRRLVEAMGGLIGLDSKPGVGSVFWFCLPLAAPTDPGAASAKAQTKQALFN